MVVFPSAYGIPNNLCVWRRKRHFAARIEEPGVCSLRSARDPRAIRAGHAP